MSKEPLSTCNEMFGRTLQHFLGSCQESKDGTSLSRLSPIDTQSFRVLLSFYRSDRDKPPITCRNDIQDFRVFFIDFQCGFHRCYRDSYPITCRTTSGQLPDVQDFRVLKY